LELSTFQFGSKVQTSEPSTFPVLSLNIARDTIDPDIDKNLDLKKFLKRNYSDFSSLAREEQIFSVPFQSRFQVLEKISLSPLDSQGFPNQYFDH
jgi:hypothetical protein